MKKLISIAFVLVLVLSLAPAAFASSAADILDPGSAIIPGGWISFSSHTHEFGEWQTLRTPTETKTGLMVRYCTVKGCNEYEEAETEELPNAYISETRDSEKLRSAAVTGAIVGDDASLHDWTCSQMVDQLKLLTSRYFYQAVQVKYEGLGIGSFVDETEHTVSLSAEQLERLMEAREGLCLQLTTARASILLDADTVKNLGAEKSIALTTVWEDDALTVKVLVDSKAVSVPVRVLTWCDKDGKYIGNADSELMWGVNGGPKYLMAYSSINSGDSLELTDYEEKPEGWGRFPYTAHWKLRLGDKFAE